MKSPIIYCVKAMYNTQKGRKNTTHQKSFYANKNILLNRKNAQNYFNLIIDLLADFNEIVVNWETDSINEKQAYINHQFEDVQFLDEDRKAEGIRFGFKLNTDIASQFHLNADTFYELDFLDTKTEKRILNAEENRKIEHQIINTIYPPKHKLLKDKKHQFDLFKIGELIKTDNIFELQIIKNLDEISLLFESICAFLNSEKGGYIVFRNTENENQQISDLEFDNITDIIQNHVFKKYKSNILKTKISGLYLFSNAIGKAIPVIKINPFAPQNACYKTNQTHSKFIRHKIFGNVECLD